MEAVCATIYGMEMSLGLSPDELAILTPLTSARKIQDFLDTLAINHEKRGETNLSPRQVLREGKAHCLEGALLAATAFWLTGERPLVMELGVKDRDDDHALALYRVNGYWGAVSKTNHTCLRFRDPIYKTVRELALSYFHEYFITETGEKILRSYTRPISLRKFGIEWITREDEVWDVAWAIHKSPHYSLLPKENKRHVREADHVERKGAKIEEWPVSSPKT